MIRFICFLYGFTLFCGLVNATPNCPQGHCAQISVKMNTYCIAKGLAGKQFMVFGPNGEECFCPCSCVTPETKIDLLEGITRIDGLEPEAALYTPFSGEKSSVLDKKMISEVNDSKLIVLTFENGSTIRASSNHTYITPEETVISAEELSEGQLVLDKNRQSVLVSKKDEIQYSGTLLNVVVNEKSPHAENHVISINGILSGDWLLQSHNDSIEAGIDIRSGLINTYNE